MGFDKLVLIFRRKCKCSRIAKTALKKERTKRGILSDKMSKYITESF